MLALVLVAAGAVAWLLLVYPKRPGPGGGRTVQIEIGPDFDVERLAHRLVAERVIEDAFLWSTYVHVLGAEDQLRRGSILLTDDMTPAEVTRRVARGLGSVEVRVTIPEGFTRFEIARRLEAFGVCNADDFLAATADASAARALGIAGDTFEGYLFPDTYQLEQDADAAEVATKMARTWKRRVDPIVRENAAGLAALERELRFGVHDVVTLASIVEKEAAAREEQAIIAGVFLNRLRSPEFTPKRLQADPTVSYGCLAARDRAPTCASFDGRVTAAMVRDAQNPYNTYRIEGLPPGPIANPGIGAIRAVLAPARHDFLYFVARGGRRHQFSATLDEHNRAIERYLRSGSH